MNIGVLGQSGPLLTILRKDARLIAEPLAYEKNNQEFFINHQKPRSAKMVDSDRTLNSEVPDRTTAILGIMKYALLWQV